jgi:hypothetical protein
VMYEGRIVGSFDAAAADVHEIGLLMTGGGDDGGSAGEGSAGDDTLRDVVGEPPQ